MLIYQATKKEFMEQVSDKSITHKIYDIYRSKIGRTTKSEIRSWENSMVFMAEVLNTNKIPGNAGIAIEFNIPFTSKRVDFMISGFGEKEANIIIVELKQWGSAFKVNEKDGIVKTLLGKGGVLRETTHPSYQVYTYYHLIKEYNETIRNENINLFPCAYLHNFEKEYKNELIDAVYDPYLSKAPIFLKGDCIALRKMIESHITEGDNKLLLFKLDDGKLRPSKTLQNVLGKMLDGNEEFTLIDDQKVVYENALKLAKESNIDNKKRVLIVEGGPGTGKSVVAINLLVKFNQGGIPSQYVSKNAAPRNVYSQKLRKNYNQKYISSLFSGSGAYFNSPKSIFGALIADEAHRLNEKSGMYGNLGENQIKEIIYASKFSIFFIDENQKISFSDIGSVKEIKKWAEELGAEITTLKLESQFRCNGSDSYLSWLDDVLEIKETANFDGFDLNYDFKIFSDPNDLKKAIVEKNNINNKSRLVAGYCWNWVKEGKSKKEIHDIKIPEKNFSMSWNLGNTATWLIDEESIDEVGCIHTSQGLELDYVGVIIGNDLREEGDKIITDFNERAKTDSSLRGIKKLYKENPLKANTIADELIKNTYRTLMTRGQKGCYIYCCDKSLEKYFKKRLEMFNKS
jgi:uncharacterized protein